MQQHIVKPSKVDTKENDESILSEQITTETSLTDDLVKNSGVPLEAAIKQVIKFRIPIILFSVAPFNGPSPPSVQSILDGKVYKYHLT